MANIVDKHRLEVNEFFDSNIVPLLKEFMPESVEEIQNVHDLIKKKKKHFDWIIGKYDKTYRVSAYSSYSNFVYFMIWTPDDEEEYDFKTDIPLYGSRKENK